jgi:CBS domain containing-hemolysin-like protein
LAVVVPVCLLSAGIVLGAGLAAQEQVSAGYSKTDAGLLVMYVLMALVFSFLCSIAEAVLLSMTPSFIEDLKQKRPKRAALLNKLKQENIDRSLAAILTLNTIAHTVGAIGSGAKATAVFGSAYFGMFSAVMTLMILFLSEIIPKTLGAVYWRRLAGLTGQFVRWLIYLLYPLILISEMLTKWIARGKTVHAFNRNEFIAMALMGEQSGQLKGDESRIIRNLFTLASLTAEDIMTPRTVIFALGENTTVSEAMAEVGDGPFSRLPVYGKTLDDIRGFVLKDDIMLNQAQGKSDVTLVKLKHEIKFVPASMPISDLLGFFLERRSHIALVVGSYGGTEGLVTLEDVVETLLGMEIMDEDDVAMDMQSLARKQWKKRAEKLGLRVDNEEP